MIPNRYGALANCVEARRVLFEEGKLSLPASEGYPVIVTAGENKEEREVLAEHSEKLSADTSRGFLNAKIIRQPNTKDIHEIIIDPEVTSIAFLGDGNFSTFHMPQTKAGTMERVSWYNLARMATHLKQGTVEQRTCSMIIEANREARVALPAFIVADQTKIISSVDKSFASHCGFVVFNQHIGSVYELPHNDRDQLRQPIGFKLPS